MLLAKVMDQKIVIWILQFFSFFAISKLSNHQINLFANVTRCYTWKLADSRHGRLHGGGGLEGVGAGARGRGLAQLQGLEVEPQLTDVVVHLVDGEGADGGGGGGGVGGGVAGVAEVGVVVGDGGAGAGAGGLGHNAAHTKARRAIPSRRAPSKIL